MVGSLFENVSINRDHGSILVWAVASLRKAQLPSLVKKGSGVSRFPPGPHRRLNLRLPRQTTSAVWQRVIASRYGKFPDADFGGVRGCTSTCTCYTSKCPAWQREFSVQSCSYVGRYQAQDLTAKDWVARRIPICLTSLSGPYSWIMGSSGSSRRLKCSSRHCLSSTDCAYVSA